MVFFDFLRDRQIFTLATAKQAIPNLLAEKRQKSEEKKPQGTRERWRPEYYREIVNGYRDARIAVAGLGTGDANQE